MKTLTKIGITGIGSIAVVLLTPAISMAEINQAAAKSNNGHSLVHRVSHSLASASSYRTDGTAGYKWGNKADHNNSKQEWVQSAVTRGGYKWGNSSTTKDSSQSYAGSSYQWGTMSFSEQSAYKWGIRNSVDQTAYKWGIR